MKHQRRIVSIGLLIEIIVVASFWAFIVCAGFVVSTLLPIISIIQIYDTSLPDSNS
jgi:hypothetical protein